MPAGLSITSTPLSSGFLLFWIAARSFSWTMIPIRDDQPRFSTPCLNYFIIGLNVIAFLFELSIGSNNPRALNAFIDEFGVVPSYFTHALEGNAHASLAAGLLSILTSMFLHGSWLHIIGNMWALYIFGDNIEDRLGHGTYLAFYLICGFVASFTHILLNLGSNVPSVGASGAIAGVMGGTATEPGSSFARYSGPPAHS